MTKRLITLLPFVIWLAGCGEMPRDAESATPTAPIPVKVVTLDAQQWPSIYEATGTVRARASAVIAAKWMGYVREVKVQAGDRVREGQLLVVLDARDLDASSNRAAAAREEIRSGIPEAENAVAAAKATLDLAQVTFKRMNELYLKKSISDQEFDEASAELKAAQASFDMARAKRGQFDSKLALAEQEVRATEVTRTYAEIQAPFAGIVTAKSVDPGNLAVPGASLLTIERDSYRLEADVEESRSRAIHLGQLVTVTLDGIDHAFDARVSEIVPSVDAASRSYTVKIDLPSASGVRSGSFGRAAFPSGSRPVLAVPSAAVNEHGQLQSVFVAEGGTAHARLITLGNRDKDQIEVLSGLNAGEKVIVPVPQGLTDGAKVEVQP